MIESLKISGLRQSDIAALLGVSRLTIHNYFAGKSKPHVLIQKRVEKLANVLDNLVSKGILPARDAAIQQKVVERIAESMTAKGT